MAYPSANAIRTGSGGLVFPPAGRCIYCRNSGPLTTEHIVPFGLFGDLVLPEASCSACQKIIGKFESVVLQRMLGVHRRKFKYRSQTKKKRRNAIKATIYRMEEDGSETPIDLELDQFPFHSWALPVFDAPGIAWKESFERVTSADRLAYNLGVADLESALAAAGGTRPIKTRMFYDPHMFMRFLAKMAHAYACATLGAESFTPLLPKLILEGHEKPRIFVGGETLIEPARPEVFEIGLGTLARSDGVVFLGVRIRLLDYLGTPTYSVVVGEGFKDDLSAMQNSAYAKPIKISVMGTDGIPIFRVGF